jgi:hypothetical protein
MPDGPLALHSDFRDDVSKAIRVMESLRRQLQLTTNTLKTTLQRDYDDDEWVEFCRNIIEHSRTLVEKTK